MSGGQRQRVWIAMALAQETDLLLLDEPTTYLDLTHQIEVLDLLTDLNRRRETTIVIVMHDLNLACRYADHLIAMTDGPITAPGRTGRGDHRRDHASRCSACPPRSSPTRSRVRRRSCRSVGTTALPPTPAYEGREIPASPRRSLCTRRRSQAARRCCGCDVLGQPPGLRGAGPGRVRVLVVGQGRGGRTGDGSR